MTVNRSANEAAIEEVLSRVNSLLQPERAAAPAAPRREPRPARSLSRDDELSPASPPSTPQAGPPSAKFLPLEPRSLEESGVSEGEATGLLLRSLQNQPSMTGVELAEQVALPFTVVDRLMQGLKADRLVALKGRAALSDYLYEMTEAGFDRARKLSEHRRYAGPAPVPLPEYVAAVAQQSLTRYTPTRADLERAFADLVLAPAMFERLGRAVYSGKGLFLHGPPGNGKTSIAERVTRAYGQTIWIPRVIGAWGEIIQLFDPSMHVEVPLTPAESLQEGTRIDRRWVRIERPTIVVGGELTMDRLELTANAENGVCEAPLQLKSNCGTLVIDDFGRQRVSPAELLNRWIVPLEKRHDYLNLPSGRKIQVPFDQLIVFSTNLEPRDLVDDAFLRRIPYKIEVRDPSETEFRALFRVMAAKLGMEFCPATLDRLIETHYRATGRPFRFCHPRDLLRQVEVYCLFTGCHSRMTPAALDAAAEDFFAVL